MLKTYGFHSFVQRPHFSQYAKNLFRASFSTPSDIAAYPRPRATPNQMLWDEYYIQFPTNRGQAGTRQILYLFLAT